MSLFGFPLYIRLRQIKRVWTDEYWTNTSTVQICMKSVVHPNTFHSDECDQNWKPSFSEKVTVWMELIMWSSLFCPLHELCNATVCISSPRGERFPLSDLTWSPWQLHREREMFQRWSVWIIFLFEGHVSVKHKLHYVWSSCILWVSVTHWRTWGLPQKCSLYFCWAMVFFSPPPPTPHKQQVNSQSIKSFGFCFSRYALSCQGGSMIDSWLELLYCSEPADCTCPSRTISSYTQFRLLPLLRQGFCANRTHCIVGCSELGNCPLFGLCVPVKEKPWL